MVNRMNRNVAGELDKLNENDTQAVLSYISRLLSSRRSQSKEIQRMTTLSARSRMRMRPDVPGRCRKWER